MALSKKQIIDLFNEACRETFNGLERFRHFARAIEAEARKDDDALIRQLVEAMEGVKALNMGGELALWTAEFDRLLSAITAARARLGEKT